jgi:hypothetical protein
MRRLAPSTIAAWRASTLPYETIADKLMVSHITVWKWLRGHVISDRCADRVVRFSATLGIAEDAVFASTRPSPLTDADEPDMDDGVITLHLPDALIDKLDRAAQRRGLTRLQAVELSIRGFCVATLHQNPVPRSAPETKRA